MLRHCKRFLLLCNKDLKIFICFFADLKLLFNTSSHEEDRKSFWFSTDKNRPTSRSIVA